MYQKDHLFNESLFITQKKRGYRFSSDPLILANLVKTPLGRDVADFGTGCGIIPLILCKRFENIDVTTFEIQNDLAYLARKNAAENGLSQRIKVINCDIKDLEEKDCFDLIVSNPPYIKRGAGRLNPVEESMIARHEVKITISDIVLKASRLLKKGGSFAVIYPVLRLDELVRDLQSNGLTPVSLTMIISKPEKKPELFFLEAVKGDGKLEENPPFYIYKENRTYSEDMENIIAGRFL